MMSIIWVKHFGKLLIVYGSGLSGGKFNLSHTAEENGRDSSSDSYFDSVIASVVAATNQNLENSERQTV